VAFAPGLLGYALVAHLTRALYARHNGRSATVAAVVGWLLVVVADLVLVPLVSSAHVVTALGVGNSIGMTVAGAALLVAVRRSAGPAALAGILRAVAVSVIVGVVAFAIGRAVLAVIGSGGSALGSLGLGSVAGVAALALGAVVAWGLARDDVDAFAGALRRGVGR
jgi:putative peptidoglycan lipid II flippase